MLASFLLLLVSLSRDAAPPPPFTWMIQGLGPPKSQTIVVTICITPVLLGSGKTVPTVETIRLAPLPSRDNPKPRAIRPLKTEPAPEPRARCDGRVQAWFTTPGGRFHLVVTLSDESTHRIDVYRRHPPSKPKIIGPPMDVTLFKT